MFTFYPATHFSIVVDYSSIGGYMGIPDGIPLSEEELVQQARKLEVGEKLEFTLSTTMTNNEIRLLTRRLSINVNQGFSNKVILVNRSQYVLTFRCHQYEQ